MLAALIAFLLLAVQPAQTTIGACMLIGGYSRAVPDTPITTLAGTDAWATDGEAALINGETVGWAYLDDTDGARRMVSFHAYAGNLYAFVYVHPDSPARRYPGDPPGTWHGACMLEIRSGQ